MKNIEDRVQYLMSEINFYFHAKIQQKLQKDPQSINQECKEFCSISRFFDNFLFFFNCHDIHKILGIILIVVLHAQRRTRSAINFCQLFSLGINNTAGQETVER